MITMGQKWMAGIRNWVRLMKHPDTPLVIWRNTHGYDLLRQVLKDRCEECDYILSSDPMKVKEIFSHKEQKTKHVCDMCSAIHHSLYGNHGLTIFNYFRNIDDEEIKDKENFNRRKNS